MNDETTKEWLEAWKKRLTKAINLLLDPAKNSYVVSIYEDGTLSKECSIHTSFLSVL
ncbi:MAG: hypothetical protein ACFCU1_02635 [Sumerlaeia bacterium]